VKYVAGEKEAAVAARRRTMECIAFDSHKHYTWALAQDETGNLLDKLFSGDQPGGIVPAEPQVPP
jgi:hypothetical protein